MATPTQQPDEISEEVFAGPVPTATVYVCRDMTIVIASHITTNMAPRSNGTLTMAGIAP